MNPILPRPARVETERRLRIAVILLISFFWLPPAAWGEEKITVEIEGVEGALLENVQAYLSLEEPPSPLTESTLRRFYRQAPEEIHQALQALGYYQPRIDSELTRAEERWVARFKIDPGPPVRVARIDLTVTGEGRGDSAFDELLAEIPLREGETFHHGEYERTKEMLQNLAAERGYFDARFMTHRAAVDLVKNEAAVEIGFDTGSRYRLGEVRFKQEEPAFDPRFLARFVPFEPGEPYHADQILALNSLLVNSAYFARVDLRPLREEAADHTVPIEVTAIARKQYALSIGLGYGTDTGPRAILGWDNHRVNEWGHRFSSELELSVLRQSLTADYQIPLRRPATDKVDLQAGIQREETETAESRLAKIGVSRSVLRGSRWIETLFLNYQSETFEVGGEVGHSRLILPGVTWTRTLADGSLNPRRGSRVSFTVRGTDEVLFSDIRLLQSEVRAKIIRPVRSSGRILLRGEFGWTSVSNFNDLPVSLRFFAGGDRSVRGYGYNTLGPENESGEVIGGRYLATGSVEYDYRIAEQWGVALFYDIGNAANDWDLNPQDSVGVGGRWYSPVGPIRVDLAYALDRPGFALRVHINMGPDL
ncbi:autotransporter assembly complex protein TamA [Candidatus Manganitrophus noduliformans]|uniref:Translocation and assembly module subunit TamA n=1 Tax=Candidatus Manganitrophus noduliformans TaxID=2606439 RepID=A0A7X6ID47_9BACT|nr:autotransporter assembly complex family protein [Candidatus Manganitrophus noduliformans]NKE73225.1 outer membrane protein assembly factor [Candidatus Manganitrophus noduliformans]